MPCDLAFAIVSVVELAMMFGTRTPSAWKSDRFTRRSLWKGLAEWVPA